VRVNSVALLLLSVWLLVSLLRLPDLGFSTLGEWLRDPLAAVPMLLLVGTTFWHIQHGLREIIDDYTHTESGGCCGSPARLLRLWRRAVRAFCVLKIAFGGGAL
jgi:succinate dehydrogenase / fumarate reductase membrane anchor subunit